MSRYTGMFRLYPVKNSGEDGFVVNDKDVIKHSILNLINTHKGSRVYDPDYGTNIHKLVYELNIKRTRNIAKTEIKHVIEKYEPRAELIEVNAFTGKNDKANEVTIVVVVKYIEYNETEEIKILLESEADWINEEGEHIDPIKEWFDSK